MVRLAEALRSDIVAGNVSSFGEILHESWMLKRELAAGVSSNFIDNLYDRGRAAGAVGGKILGAGGGGFLLLRPPRAPCGDYGGTSGIAPGGNVV